MRSEDRKPSRRVFPLLQNLDLDTVTFAQVQSTGDPISIEDMNEQEMVDLIIVNLARLAVAGEWTGLLEAGGGGGGAVLTPEGVIASAYNLDMVTLAPPWGCGGNYSSYYVKQEPHFVPFIAANDGTVNSISIYVETTASGANTLELAIYSDGTGVPLAMMTECVFDGETAGQQDQTSLTGTAVLEAGTQYWIGFCETGAPGFKLQTVSTANPIQPPSNSFATGYHCYQLAAGTSDFSLPATITADTIAQSTFDLNILVGLKYA
jgi:hypothetical protein